MSNDPEDYIIWHPTSSMAGPELVVSFVNSLRAANRNGHPRLHLVGLRHVDWQHPKWFVRFLFVVKVAREAGMRITCDNLGGDELLYLLDPMNSVNEEFAAAVFPDDLEDHFQFLLRGRPVSYAGHLTAHFPYNRHFTGTTQNMESSSEEESEDDEDMQ